MRRHKKRAVLPLLVVPVLCVLAFQLYQPAAAALEFDRGADLRQNALIMKWPAKTKGGLFPDGSFGIAEIRGRVWTRVHIGSGVVVNAALESSGNFLSGDNDIFGEGSSLLGTSIPLEVWDWTNDHIDEPGTSLKTRIERLYIRWRIGRFDIDIGRQPISLGTSHFVGVLDVLAPFAPGDLDATYKPGIDAVRIRRGIGMMGEAEIIAVGAEEMSGGAVLGRSRMSIRGIDIECVGGRFRRRGFGGIGWEGELRETGVWGEVALFDRRPDVEKRRGGWSRAAFSGVAGLDFSLPRKFKVGYSILYQDFGVRDPKELLEVYDDAPFREGWVFLRSASYLVLSMHREMHPLVQADFAGIINLIDQSTLWQPRVTINTGDNTDLSFYGWIGTGDRARFDGTDVTNLSEFGSMPDGAGFYARWFF